MEFEKGKIVTCLQKDAEKMIEEITKQGFKYRVLGFRRAREIDISGEVLEFSIQIL